MKKSLLLLPLLAGFLCSCTPTPNPTEIKVESVSLSETSKNIEVGEEFSLNATVKPDNATNKNVTWSSLNESIVTVTDGVLTPVSIGTTTVEVTTEDGGFTASCSVTIIAAAERTYELRPSVSSIPFMSGKGSYELSCDIYEVKEKLGNGNIKYITVKNLTEKGEIDFSNCDLIDEAARELVHNRSEIEKGDILFASICPLGRCYLITSEHESWDINESVFSIRPNYTNVTSVFLYAVLRDPYYVKKMTQKATGSIFKGIRIDDIEKIELVLPEKNIIDLYTEKVKSIINKQALLQEENMKLTVLRDKLLPLLMNGQVVVE